jgi:hypothetical protein
MCNLSGSQPALDAGAVENSARNFFDRDFGRVEHRNAVRSNSDSAARTSNATWLADE